MAGDALLDVPERVRDGSHVLFVDDVFADGSGEGFTRTAAVSFHPPEPGTGPVHETLLPVSMLGPDVAPGAAYRVEVAGSDLTDVVSDPEAAIERAAATVPESQFLVPLVWADEWAGDVAVAPHLLPFARNHSVPSTAVPDRATWPVTCAGRATTRSFATVVSASETSSSTFVSSRRFPPTSVSSGVRPSPTPRPGCRSTTWPSDC